MDETWSLETDGVTMCALVGAVGNMEETSRY
jgi:hypothetical protein